MTNQTQNKLIYLPIYLSDYVSQSRKLTMLQRGAFIDLSVLYFQENLKLNYSKQQIYRMVFALEKNEQEAVDFVLDNFFTKSENKPMGYSWVSNELDKLGDKVLKRLNANRENGKKGGRGNKKENKPMGSNLLNPNKSILNEIKLNETKINEINIKKTQLNFQKPTIEEIKNYCLERKNNVDANKFFDFYESKGWKVGNSTMKNWQACVRTWEQRSNQTKFTNQSQNSYTKPDDLDYYARMIAHNSNGGKNGV